MPRAACDFSASVPQPARRRDYRKPDYLVDHVHLEFDLSDLGCVKVACRAVYTRDDDAGPEAPLVLNARDLELLSVRIDGRALGEHEYSLDDRQLVLRICPAPSNWKFTTASWRPATCR